MLSERATQKVQAGLRAEWPTYMAALAAVKESCDGPFLDYVSQQLIAPDRIKKLAAIDPNDSPNIIYDKLSAKFPGDFIWLLNTSVFIPHIRRKIAHTTAGNLPAVDALYSIDSDRTAQLRCDGFTLLPEILNRDEIAAMSAFLQSRSKFNQSGPTRRNMIEDIAQAPHALKLATDSRLLALAADFLGGAPTIVEMDAWWSDPVAGNDFEQHVFHRDKDDFLACKFFIYLTDVESGDGQHMYVKRSQDLDFVREHLASNQLPADLLQNAFFLTKGGKHFAARIPEIFAGQITEVLGPAGTCFMDDSFGYHAGSPPTKRVRGILTVTYATIAYPMRLMRFSGTDLDRLPPDCADTALSKHAARLFFMPTA